jgi:hypothetical protein
MTWSAAPWRPLLRGLAVLAWLGLAGCTPKIGHQCVLSTDCGTQGGLVCDPTVPGGYCTLTNCQPNLCPDEAACVLFESNLPGCAVNDRNGPMGARTGESFCMEQCHKQSDCRAGYICADPRQPPWNAQILDDDQTQHICIADPTASAEDSGTDYDAAVCQATGPMLPPLDAAITYSPDASYDAPADVSLVDSSVDSSASETDSSQADSSSHEAGMLDGGSPEGGAPESGPPDSGSADSGSDSGASDTGAPDAPDSAG